MKNKIILAVLAIILLASSSVQTSQALDWLRGNEGYTTYSCITSGGQIGMGCHYTGGVTNCNDSSGCAGINL